MVLALSETVMAPTDEKMEELACRPQLGDVSVGRRHASRYRKWYLDRRAHRPQLCKGSMILSCTQGRGCSTHWWQMDSLVHFHCEHP